jgi:hypothetical protein
VIWLYFGFLFYPGAILVLKLKEKEWKNEDDIKTIVGCVLFIIGLSILFYYQDWFTFDHDGPLFNEIMIWKN